jgi:hypothetical protein
MHDLGGTSGASRPIGHSVEAPAGATNDFRRRIAVYFAARGQDLILLVSLVGLCWVERVATLERPNSGGDVVEKWEFIRQWFYSSSFRHGEWNHHMTRWGTNVPAYVAQLLFGHGLRAYYVAPIAACLVEVAFTYGCGKRLAGRLGGVLAALLLIQTGAMAIAGSQLLPDLFTGTYAIAAMYLYLRYVDAQGRARTRWLIATAAVCFLGYLAKETMVFFFPGFLLAIWLAERRLPPLAIFCIVLCAGFVLESLGYRIFTPYASRLTIVRESHGSDGAPTTTFVELFDRYQQMDPPMVRAFYFFVPCFFGVLAVYRDYRARAVLAVVASFLFFLTFLVRGIHPPLLWHRFMSRYFDPTVPLMQLVSGVFLAFLLRQLWQELKEWPLVTRLNQLPGIQYYGTGFAVFLSLTYAGCSYHGFKESFEDHPFKVSPVLATVANDAYRRNLPIYSKEWTGSDRADYDRDLHTVYGIYMDVRLLVRDGKLPRFDQAKRVLKAYTYLLRDPLAYSDDQILAMIRSGCAVNIRERRTYATASPMTVLSPACDDKPPL